MLSDNASRVQGTSRVGRSWTTWAATAIAAVAFVVLVSWVNPNIRQIPDDFSFAHLVGGLLRILLLFAGLALPGVFLARQGHRVAWAAPVGLAVAFGWQGVFMGTLIVADYRWNSSVLVGLVLVLTPGLVCSLRGARAHPVGDPGMGFRASAAYALLLFATSLVAVGLPHAAGIVGMRDQSIYVNASVLILGMTAFGLRNAGRRTMALALIIVLPLLLSQVLGYQISGLLGWESSLSAAVLNPVLDHGPLLAALVLVGVIAVVAAEVLRTRFGSEVTVDSQVPSGPTA